jgi:hypothetical protein
VNFPSQPGSFSISKSDGQVAANNYVAQNLAAYTSITATAYFQIAVGTLQLTNISQLDRTITIDANGQVIAADKYHITNQSPNIMTTFIVDVPTTATNIVVKDAFGGMLATENAGSISYGGSNTIQAELINATLVTYLGYGQSATITAQYNLPSASLQGSTYTLNNVYLYPDFYYYVAQANIVINPPEGATIVTPISSLDPTATLTRSSFQDTLTITRDGVSYLDYSIPQNNTVQLSYNYNPVWVSFRPTFWLSAIAVIGCVAVVIVKKRKPGEKETVKAKAEKPSTPKPVYAPSQQTVKTVGSPANQHLTTDDIKEFTDAYEEKKELNAELKSLDSKAQKGKIPRRQYKVQRQTIETRLETLDKNISKLKDLFQASGSANADLVKQLDSVEEDLADAEENIRMLESQQKTGEISIETYKENIGDYQKQKDKAESTINGILLRLREKTR